MMKKIAYILFSISVLLNIYYTFDYYKTLQNQEFAKIFIENTKIKNVSMEEGNTFLFEKLDFVLPKHSAKRKYYFISIWNTLCKPCLKEMPLLDSLAEKINRPDISYIYLTENNYDLVHKFRKVRNLNSKNFVFINDADLYISSVLKKHNMNVRQYPIQIIIDSNGNEKYFQIGAIEKSDFLRLINICKSI